MITTRNTTAFVAIEVRRALVEVPACSCCLSAVVDMASWQAARHGRSTLATGANSEALPARQCKVADDRNFSHEQTRRIEQAANVYTFICTRRAALIEAWPV